MLDWLLENFPKQRLLLKLAQGHSLLHTCSYQARKALFMVDVFLSRRYQSVSMEIMKGFYLAFLFLGVSSLHVFAAHVFPGARHSDEVVKSVTFRSPAFTLGPGEVQNTYYQGVPFVEGHVALKAFDAEVVDESGNSVPLNEVYLHHWVALNYIGTNSTDYVPHGPISSSGSIIGNDGVCPNHALSQIYGLGSETRKTSTYLPGPYGIEVGKYENELWLLNVHAIDTRGTIDPFGCLECRCDLYNVTVGEDGKPLRDGYQGGLFCCYDGVRCQLKDGYVGENRTYYLEYTVHYQEWDDSILPLKIYIFDSTFEGSTCKVEYDVSPCSSEEIGTSECIHTQESTMEVPIGGEVVYAVAHQHKGGVGAAIYGQDGREICTSVPMYGNGTQPGNEAGYIVGMGTCYPEPGSLHVLNGESIRMLSNYSRSEFHTGVMGLGYIAVYPHSEAYAM
ncbi:hypothetical protein KP509_23G063800 [Ceratopteris richardii]|uniref:Uncharacterized protein n=2 Tax=Ceratopteris richardii TaxID=49495 RepID=A0A8T2S0L3_CERRI|nr:hypothetical protein KP509_23G063800 [Ceratopteris richardii]